MAKLASCNEVPITQRKRLILLRSVLNAKRKYQYDSNSQAHLLQEEGDFITLLFYFIRCAFRPPKRWLHLGHRPASVLTFPRQPQFRQSVDWTYLLLSCFLKTLINIRKIINNAIAMPAKIEKSPIVYSPKTTVSNIVFILSSKSIIIPIHFYTYYAQLYQGSSMFSTGSYKPHPKILYSIAFHVNSTRLSWKNREKNLSDMLWHKKMRKREIIHPAPFSRGDLGETE